MLGKFSKTHLQNLEKGYFISWKNQLIFKNILLCMKHRLRKLKHIDFKNQSQIEFLKYQLFFVKS